MTAKDRSVHPRTPRRLPSLLAGVTLAASLLAGGIAAGAQSPLRSPGAVSPPHIVPQATALSGRKYLPGPNRPVPYPAYSDGCDHDYGTPDQCLPLSSPPGFRGGKDKKFDCAYLTREGWFKKPLLVRRDSLNVLPRHQKAKKAVQTPAGWELTACVDG